MIRAMATQAQALGPIATSIRTKIQAALQPETLKIVNESHKHASHYAADGSAACDAGETHFKLEIVSQAFTGVPMIKRHQQVYALLSDEIAAGVHALSMSTKTAAELAPKE